MIRLFSPPTSDTLLRRNAVTAGNFVVHMIVLGLLAVPVGRAVKESILDRLVVYLVPPDKPTAQEDALGEAPFAARATDAGIATRGASAVAEGPADEGIVARGEVPVLSAADLEAASRPLPTDNALTELEVDSTVLRDPSSAAPGYPPLLLKKGVEGNAAVIYVVDTLGAVDTMTYRVIATTHPEFAVAVRQALPDMRFRPAVQHGRRVRQLVQQNFRFRITRDSIRPPDASPPPA